ncbi:hypothetical protein D3C87_1964820 [compost metagenome]
MVFLLATVTLKALPVAPLALSRMSTVEELTSSSSGSADLADAREPLTGAPSSSGGRSTPLLAV